jgi:hypothetical protein
MNETRAIARGLARPQLLSRGLAVLMCAQPLLGLIFSDQYRDAEPIRTTWFGNDWVTLLLGVPLLLVGAVRAAHGSTRGLLLWLGMMAYALYNYAFYLVGAALNAFFPLYVVAVMVAAIALMLTLSRLDVAAVAGGCRPAAPVRVIGGALACIGIGLAAVWVGMWAAHVFAGRPTPIDPEAFKIVAALDLTLMVPALTAGGVLLWRRHPWGYVIASLASVQGALYLLVLSVNSLIAIQRGLSSAPGELLIWVPLTIATSGIALTLLTSLRGQRVVS